MRLNYDVIGVGSPLQDVLARVEDTHLARVGGDKGGMVLVDDGQMAQLLADLPGEPARAPGGSAANTIVGLARLGTKTTFLGKVGADPEGELYRELLGAQGVDGSRFKVGTGVASGMCLSYITPDSQRTMRTNLGAAATLAPDEVTDADFEGCRHVHVEGYLLFNEALIAKVLQGAKKAGCTVSLDLAAFEVVDANKGVLPDLLGQYIDVIFANEDEARAFCGSDDPTKGLAALGEHCDAVAVKVGAEGAYLKRGDEQTKVDANRVVAIDTTGAGDLWASGFLYGMLNGRDLATCGRYGAITGAEVVQVIGAAIPDERWNNIKEQCAL